MCVQRIQQHDIFQSAGTTSEFHVASFLCVHNVRGVYENIVLGRAAVIRRCGRQSERASGQCPPSWSEVRAKGGVPSAHIAVIGPRSSQNQRARSTGTEADGNVSGWARRWKLSRK